MYKENTMRLSQRFRKAEGVSLIEVIVVVTVVAIMLTIGIVNMPRGRMQVNEAARTFAADLNRARTEAIKLNTNVAFELVSGQYRVYADPDRNRTPTSNLNGLTVKTPIFQRAFTSDFPLASLSDGGSITSDQNSANQNIVWFDSRGLPRSQSGQFIGKTFSIQSSKGDYTQQIQLASQGRISVVTP